MEYRTIEGVELLTVGAQWHASTGDVTVTFEHLADMVAAANDDSQIRPPRVKIGHGVQLVGSLGDHDPFWDGQPAFGSVANLRLDNDGAVLVGDLVEVPDWLAEAMPSAWPTRSCEWVFDIETNRGRRYSAVLTAVAVGSWLPAVEDLDDLQRLLEEGPAELDLATASAADPERTQMPTETPPAASVDVDVIRRRFNMEWATDPDNNAPDGVDTYWWWARSIRVDPDEIIADDDEGSLWRIPFTTDGADEVTFDEPQRVREEFVPVNASVGTAVKALTDRTRQRVAASGLTRPDKTDPSNPAASRPDPEEETTMTDLDMDALRSRLGLPEDATEEQINEALTAEPEGTEPEPPAEDAQTRESQTPEPVAASDGMTVTLDAGVLAELQRQAAEGSAARAEQVTEQREKVLAAAIKAGKIAPSSKDAWRSKLQETPEATAAELDKLPAGLIPVDETELGNGGSESADASAYPDNWFPELREKSAGAVTQE
jgi:hypothetical protein